MKLQSRTVNSSALYMVPTVCDNIKNASKLRYDNITMWV